MLCGGRSVGGEHDSTGLVRELTRDGRRGEGGRVQRVKRDASLGEAAVPELPGAWKWSAGVVHSTVRRGVRCSTPTAAAGWRIS